jgi:hypothetical protein
MGSDGAANDTELLVIQRSSSENAARYAAKVHGTSSKQISVKRSALSICFYY